VSLLFTVECEINVPCVQTMFCFSVSLKSKIYIKKLDFYLLFCIVTKFGI
jgi:hypothetical protein